MEITYSKTKKVESHFVTNFPSEHYITNFTSKEVNNCRECPYLVGVKNRTKVQLYFIEKLNKCSITKKSMSWVSMHVRVLKSCPFRKEV